MRSLIICVCGVIALLFLVSIRNVLYSTSGQLSNPLRTHTTKIVLPTQVEVHHQHLQHLAWDVTINKKRNSATLKLVKLLVNSKTQTEGTDFEIIMPILTQQWPLQLNRRHASNIKNLKGATILSKEPNICHHTKYSGIQFTSSVRMNHSETQQKVACQWHRRKKWV